MPTISFLKSGTCNSSLFFSSNRQHLKMQLFHRQIFLQRRSLQYPMLYLHLHYNILIFHHCTILLLLSWYLSMHYPKKQSLYLARTIYTYLLLIQPCPRQIQIFQTLYCKHFFCSRTPGFEDSIASILLASFSDKQSYHLDNYHPPIVAYHLFSHYQ